MEPPLTALALAVLPVTQRFCLMFLRTGVMGVDNREQAG